MIKNIILSVVVLGVLIYGGYKFFGNSENQAATEVTVETQTEATTTDKVMDTQPHTVTIETNEGTIVFQTYTADAPHTVANFVTLASKGFYNNLTFHRV